MFVNATKIYQFKAKKQSFEIKRYLLCLENISGDVSANNMKKAGLNGFVYNISVDYSTFDTSNIANIHKYLIKKTWYEIMFGLIKKMFIMLFNQQSKWI